MPRPLKPTADLRVFAFLYPDLQTLHKTATHILRTNGYEANARILEAHTGTDRAGLIKAIEAAGVRVLG